MWQNSIIGFIPVEVRSLDHKQERRTRFGKIIINGEMARRNVVCAGDRLIYIFFIVWSYFSGSLFRSPTNGVRGNPKMAQSLEIVFYRQLCCCTLKNCSYGGGFSIFSCATEYFSLYAERITRIYILLLVLLCFSLSVKQVFRPE